MTSHYVPQCWACPNKSYHKLNSRIRNNLQNNTILHIKHKRSSKTFKSYPKRPQTYIKDFCVHKIRSKHLYPSRRSPKYVFDKICSFKHHRKEIKKLYYTKLEASKFKLKNLKRHFHKRDQNFPTSKRSIISLFMKNFDKMSQHELISI